MFQIKREKHPNLVLVRGLPGSGKSTYANKIQLKHSAGEADHFEADMFHVKDGEYLFDQKNVRHAHMWCQAQTARSLYNGKTVIVANTFITFGELYPYIKIAKDFGAEVFIVECIGKFGNVHNVPEEVLEKMYNNWDDLEIFKGADRHEIDGVIVNCIR